MRTEAQITASRANGAISAQNGATRYPSTARDLRQNMRLMDRNETCMCRGGKRAVENLYQLRDRHKNGKFPNEPENSRE